MKRKAGSEVESPRLVCVDSIDFFCLNKRQTIWKD